MIKDKTKFAYAIGRIRTLESHLVTGETLKRMAEAQTFEAAFSILSETVYGTYLDQPKIHFQIDTLMQTETENTIKLLNQLAPGNETLEALFLKYIIHNLKVYILAKRAKSTSPSTALYKVYSELNEKIKTSILKTSEKLYHQLDELIEKLNLANTQKEIDQIADHWYLENLQKHARQNHIPLLIKITQSMLANAPAPSTPAQEIKQANQIMQEIKNTKYIAFGVEPLVAFYFAKLYETVNLRLILNCKKHAVPKESILNQLRETYV